MKGDKLIKLSGRFEGASKSRAYLNNGYFYPFMSKHKGK